MVTVAELSGVSLVNVPRSVTTTLRPPSVPSDPDLFFTFPFVSRPLIILATFLLIP
ncbi:hypothetical protein JVT61DRAFT_3160 [Boletus reticuloceps]|uniref:Uncharacterized protein n=1 Tax=Boletus reticuloceps TaxID=495285 RepID=A0A8I2YNT3_9AGAM|nr:hypothetical protein JVT61DRAFT_3160 [Boletus reticuloceps]